MKIYKVSYEENYGFTTTKYFKTQELAEKDIAKEIRKFKDEHSTWEDVDDYLEAKFHLNYIYLSGRKGFYTDKLKISLDPIIVKEE